MHIQCFSTFKQRGEWVELRFMAAALERGFHVLKPWGDSLAYDIGLDHHSHLVRVQVKSTTCRTRYGYLCQFKPNASSRRYSLRDLDFFVAYVIPEDAWYVIPAALLLGPRQFAVTLHPILPKHPARYRFESYKEAWPLLTQTVIESLPLHPAKETGKEMGKETGKEMGKEVGKEMEKEVGKEMEKETKNTLSFRTGLKDR
jgi:hypothetical protein